MSGLYYVELADVLTDAGVAVSVGPVNAGWESRARSSGGFPAPPLAVVWHHTASSTTPENDLAWQCHNCDDAPVGNLLLDRGGVVWPVAAGASNCAGKGGPATFSRGTIPVDQGNTHGFNCEAASDGVGELWPVVQIDAYFAVSNALNMLAGNEPSDVITHAVWAPTRKVDPAVATSVEGPWAPRASTSSGTWELADIVAECLYRAGTEEPPMTDEDVQRIAWAVWSLELGAQSAGNHLQTAAAAYQPAVDGPGLTVNYPVPVGDATADLWSVIVDTYERVKALEARG